tara:strand:- start:510 stop:1541 length:1032 start_codon:yes stop_codon:yes gene_type:complete
MRARYVLFIGVVLAGGGAVALWPDQSGVASRAGASISARPATAASPSTLGADGAAEGTPGAPVANAERPLPSHAGTSVDGGVTLDNEGRLVVTRDLRRMFDYFLTGIGRVGMAQIQARLTRYLDSLGLPDSAQAEVLDVYRDYIAYRHRVQQMPRADATAPALAQTLQTREALRREVLGVAVADAFFNEDDRMARYLVARRELQHTPGLSDAEREQRLELLERMLPDRIREARQHATLPGRAHVQIERMREAGASDAQIRARREAMLGPDAAQRLAQVDARRDAWQRRYDDYRRAHGRILANPGLAPPDRDEALESLRQTRFTAAERRRVLSLDYVNELKSRN